MVPVSGLTLCGRGWRRQKRMAFIVFARGGDVRGVKKPSERLVHWGVEGGH